MATKEHQFDISAKLDMQEVKNAVIQAQKEIDNRYDFKGIAKELDLNVSAKTLTLISSSDNKIDAMRDILISKMNKRGLSINSLEELKKEDASGGTRKYSYKIIDSIEKDEAKLIQTEIKSLKLKVSAVNQGDEIRVTGKNIDDLQAVMKHLKSLELKAPLVFDNFR
uniref:YajQ family cyclic di-GMP-binding protein n=1 Tax=Aliarcobacter sp. TaxID=2321116 RepID=UPI0040485B17